MCCVHASVCACVTVSVARQFFISASTPTPTPLFLQSADECKKIRYRDDKVVSTKGERFSVITKKDMESEDMKKTYINLKPLRHYRFH